MSLRLGGFRMDDKDTEKVRAYFRTQSKETLEDIMSILVGVIGEKER